MHATSAGAPAQAQSRGLGLALASAVAFGGSGVAAKPLIEAGFSPLHLVWMRVAGAALVLLPVALRHRTLPRLRPGLLLGFGVLGVAGCQGLYFVAISRIPVGVAILVEYLGPALLLGWVRYVQRRPVDRAAVLGVLLAVSGLACVVEIWSGLAFDPLGLLCAFGAACCQVAYFVLADHGSDAGDTPDPVAVIAYGLLVGAAVLTAVSRPWTLSFTALARRAALGDRDVPAALLLGWLVLVATVLAYLSGVVAVRRLSPQVAGVVACIEAVVGTVLAWILLGEHLGASQIAGGLLVLCGAFVAQTAAAPRTPAPGSGSGPEVSAHGVPVSGACGAPPASQVSASASAGAAGSAPVADPAATTVADPVAGLLAGPRPAAAPDHSSSLRARAARDRAAGSASAACPRP